MPQAQEWAALGRQLYKGTWKSSSLAAQFFEISPQILSQITLSETRALVRFIDTLSSKSYELAAACLAVAPRVVASVSRPDRGPFLSFASVIAEMSWADARVYFEKGPVLLHHVHAEQRTRFLLLASAVARRAGRQAYPFFAESANALGQLDPGAAQPAAGARRICWRPSPDRGDGISQERSRRCLHRLPLRRPRRLARRGASAFSR